MQHTGTGTLAGDFLHRTAEVQVDEVRTRLLYDFCRLNHCLDITTVNLNAYGALLVADGQLAKRRFDVAHQCLSTDKFGIDHSGAKPLAQHAETNVRNILHRSEEHGAFSKVDVAYLHLFCFSFLPPITYHPTPITQHPTPITQHPTPNTQHPSQNIWLTRRMPATSASISSFVLYRANEARTVPLMPKRSIRGWAQW